MSTPRVLGDSMLYGVEFRAVDGVIQERHRAPQGDGIWRPLTKIVDGQIVCSRGWTPERLRAWASLLEQPVAAKKPGRCTPKNVEASA